MVFDCKNIIFFLFFLFFHCSLDDKFKFAYSSKLCFDLKKKDKMLGTLKVNPVFMNGLVIKENHAGMVICLNCRLG